MGGDWEGRIRARVALLTEERARYLEQARQQMTAYDAAIAELTRLLEPPTARRDADTGQDGAGDAAEAEAAITA